MPRKPPAPAEELSELLRAGLRDFVTGFSRYHRLHDLPAEAATRAALRDMGHRAIGRILGMPAGVPSRPDVHRTRTRTPENADKTPKRILSRHRRGDAKLEKLKKFVRGEGPDPNLPPRGRGA